MVSTTKRNRRQCENRNGDIRKRKQKSKQVHTVEYMNEDDYRPQLQEVLYNPDYILTKIFRKEGPPLGVQFDSLPANAFRNCLASRKSRHACQDNQRAAKRQKVSVPANKEDQASLIKHGMGKGLITKMGAPVKNFGKGKGLVSGNSSSVRKHGIGKGLMTVWRVTNPDGGDFPTGVEIGEKAQEKQKRLQRQQAITKKLKEKFQSKKKKSMSISRKVATRKNEKQKVTRKEKCELSLDGMRCQEDHNRFSLLMDDEELELRELQAGPNPLTCSEHLTGNQFSGCSLCKGLLSKFPPDSVAMKHPIQSQSWDFSAEFVKKLFKAFHFLYTYAVIIDISSFTLDEFAQAFHDKDSLLLGQIHVALLKLLLSDVQMQLSRGSLHQANTNCKLLNLLHSVADQDFVLNFWQKSLNALTWTEILRQVLVQAGFGSKCGGSTKQALSKEINLMAKYGLSPGTLKNELFSILLTQGNNGMKVPELAKSSSIVDLNFAATTVELESTISSTLSSDISLFEKISLSGYRLRTAILESEILLSDTDDFGGVDSDSELSGGNITDHSECELDKPTQRNMNETNTLTFESEIDESRTGEMWLLGLVEGEYSDLSIEEKLSALVALVDLLSAGSSIRMEDPKPSFEECAPAAYRHCSGAKLKRSTTKQYHLSRQLDGCNSQIVCVTGANSTSVLHPIDSSVPMSKMHGKETSSVDNIHPMQSIYLGSDRRYNRYWLFLGPCDRLDPGHRRIYFESSEDGHWKVIHSEEAFCTLLSLLDCRGSREARLLASLEKREALLCRAMSCIPSDSMVGQISQSNQSDVNLSREDSSSAVSDVDNLSLAEMQNDLPPTGAIVPVMGKKVEHRDRSIHAQAFDSWIWKSFYCDLHVVKYGKRSYHDSLTRCEHCRDLFWRDEKHCKLCHTTFELDFDLEEKYAIHVAMCQQNAEACHSPKHKILSSQLQSLKAATYAIESVMPEGALVCAWTKSTHNLWVKRLRRTSNLIDFLRVLSDFVGAINEDWLYQLPCTSDINFDPEEVMTSFHTMPQTSSAAAMFLVKLDALVSPYLKSIQSRNNPELNTSLRSIHSRNNPELNTRSKGRCAC